MSGYMGPQVPGRPSGLPPAVEMPQIPVRVEATTTSRLTMYVLRPLWLGRRELALSLTVVALVGGGWLAGAALWPGRLAAGLVGASAAAVCLVGVVLGLPDVRARIGAMLWRSRVVRRWDRACRFAGLATHNDRVPRITRAERTPVGEVLRVRLPKGAAVADVADRIEYLTASLEVADVRAERDPDNARYVRVEVIRRDLLDEPGPVAWPWARPWLHGWQASMWDPLPVGVSAGGSVLYLALFDGSGDGDGGEAAPGGDG
ncbi:hypothetical protein AB0K60_37090 [Thermopolyspora sp. NPDC052614]|uniref:hypothetical protein n=1 Tax=Thermopolyspora sp. NPDC052614 TaxID=3155682 RepID=UPI00344A323A